MKVVNVDEKIINGLSIRTTNKAEMNPETAQLASLWGEFDKQVPVDYENGERVYGVYYQYESNLDGEFSALAGSREAVSTSTLKLEMVTINAGKYLMFTATGELPQIVIATWTKVWSYFSDEDSEYTRAYTTDFDYYSGPNEIEVYIAIQ